MVDVAVNQHAPDMRIGLAVMAALSVMALMAAGMAFTAGLGLLQTAMFAALALLGAWQVQRACHR